MQKVMFDCDNTMGVQDKDIDDGLALLYLLGREDIELIGVTTTFGNSHIDIVHQVTQHMFDMVGLSDVPLLKGAGNSGDSQREAAHFLAEAAAKSPGEITLLATGALTNLYQAYKIDPHFFTHLKQVVLMGGITAPLVINGDRLEELNVSCDPEATSQVLQSDVEVTAVTGNLCLQAFFGVKEREWLEHQQGDVYSYILKNIVPWMQYMQKRFNLKGFFNWDTTAAVYVTHPELFADHHLRVVSTIEDLKRGYLRPGELDGNSKTVNVPRAIKDMTLFNQVIFDAWGNVTLAKNMNSHFVGNQ
ncbi:nucleoside hydrolase [Tuberibacillus sp. Marseille-P3662]|uniref:nucleoside hydrolase n=1 Tax=Tuberibacillus sp. Marseille-P3662 TaxID=1965358 RepID=UPI000A1C9994|nr:nucleoside hydrolase [Tuberibacillus sp. Marseille-P3662]